MNSTPLPLPEFDNPPVVEVVLDVQFKPLEGLQVPQFGLLWQAFKDRFPRVEEHAPLGRREEMFGVRSPLSSSVQIQLVEAPIVPRLWFLNENGTELIQVQRDRFVHNWRKVGDGQYPRYRRVREAFTNELELFRQFLAREQLGDLSADLCEVTYINQIVSGSVWERHGELGRVIETWRQQEKEFLREPEDVRFLARYIIPDGGETPIGRLTIRVEPGFRPEDGRPVFVLTLSALGKPDGPGIDGAFRFLDVGHAWVVHGFTSITTDEMHRTWRRTR